MTGELAAILMATQYALTHLTKEHDSFNIYSDCQAAICAITSHTRENYHNYTIFLIRENLLEIRFRVTSNPPMVQKVLSLLQDIQKLVSLYNIIPTTNTHYTFRNSGKIPYFKTKHNFFKKFFFPLVIIEWNKLDPSL